MERRSCSNLHYINAIKGSSVTKICNVNSFGKPALVFKKLKDVYDTEDLTSCTHSSLHSAPEFSNNKVKLESQSLPLVVRTLCEIETANNDVPCGTDGDMDSDSDDYTFGKMTLKELKKNCKAKKRKHANSQCLSPQQNQIKLEAEEDDSDLKEPLISWKLNVPKAKKKKCMSSGSQSPKLAVSIKRESEDLDSESTQEFHANLVSSVHAKTEVAESEIKVFQSTISPADESFTVDHKDESAVAEVTSKGNPSKVECQCLESNPCDEDFQSCPLNEVSYDHLENIEPLHMLLPSCEEMIDAHNQEKLCQQFLHLPTSEYGKEKNIEQSTSSVKDQSAGLNGRSKCCDEFSGQCTSNPEVRAPHTSVDDTTSREEPSHAGVSSHLQDTSSNDAELQDDKSEGKQPSECRIINRVNNNLDNESHLDVMEDELSSGEERQPPTSARIDPERDSIPCRPNFAFGETSSSSAAVQTPERLLSTRKVVSPTSEERFCLAMNSAGSYGDMELLDCKEDMCNEEQTEMKSSCEESDKLDNVSKSPKVSVPVSRLKFILSPSQIQRKAKHERTSSPKGNMEGPRVSRSLPNVSTGCTSFQGCSENAIAFSRRQMQDIESLAMKLMSELKSMKDIVEEKLLFEAYRNLSLKHDADEVKNAITNATKAEEMAKKWLSMMGRDCNRFCKIMSLAQKGNTGAVPNDKVQRERKRITFADEAGGMLCHVKFFEDGMTSLKPNIVNQEDGAR